MTPAQHQRVKALFIAAGRQDPAARAEFIHRECPDDAQVRAEVEALLRADDDPLLALKTPALGVNIGKTLGAALRAPATTEMPSRLGQYRILRVLGEGGMGMVYVAEQDRPRRTVALKVIHAGPSGRALLRRFEHEAELLGRLQHPGIAQIFEAGSAPTPQGSVPYIAMELIEGPALTHYVEQNSATTTQRLELIAKVCDAVQYAHQRGVIHRDLKPANILVDIRGQPKVLDFGVARASQADANVTTMRTSMGQLIGTLPYMSPEQVLADPTPSTPAPTSIPSASSSTRSSPAASPTPSTTTHSPRPPASSAKTSPSRSAPSTACSEAKWRPSSPKPSKRTLRAATNPPPNSPTTSAATFAANPSRPARIPRCTSSPSR